MRIKPGETIDGMPMLEVRNALRRHVDGAFNADDFARYTKMNLRKARAKISALAAAGLIEPSQYGRRLWSVSSKGRRLALASATPPTTRAKAQQHLDAFLKRVKEVEQSDRWTHRVTRVLLFGSFLAGADLVSDVDLAVELAHKEQNLVRREALDEEFRRRAEAEGRQFRTFLERLFWPDTAVRLYLKSRSRVLSIHSTSDPVLKKCATKVIYQFAK